MTPSWQLMSDIPRNSQPFHNTVVPLNLVLATPMTSRSYRIPHSRAKPKKEKQPAIVSGLGPATTQFVTTHGLMNIVPLVTLIVKTYPATQWSTLLDRLSLPDSTTQSLLDSLTEDWIAINNTNY